MGTTNYPNGLDDFAGASPPNLGDNDVTGRKHTKRHDDIEAAMEAVQAELGTNPSGAAATVGAAIAGKADTGHAHSGYIAYPAGGADDDVLTKSGSGSVWKAVSGGGGGVDATAMHYKGDYMPNAYVVGDTVRYQHDLWVCIQNVGAGASAPVAPYWERAVDVPYQLNQISDVIAPSPSDGDVLVFGAASGDWANGSVAIAKVSGLETRLTSIESDVGDRIEGEVNSIKPTGPFPNGYMWIDAATNAIKVWNGSDFVDPSNAGGGSMAWAIASGGSESTVGGDKVHQFTANGTLTVTREGLAQIIVVGPGSSTSGNGNGGPVILGTVVLPVGTHAITIGVSATGQGASDWTSTRLGRVAGAGVARGVADKGDDGAAATANGVVSDITGTSREYGAGGSRKATLTNAADRYGIGGDPAISNRAGGGFVAIRYTL